MGCAVLALVLLFALTRKHEPTAHGRPLSYWIEVYAGSPIPTGKPTTVEERREAEAAIKQVGTNAIPFFLKWIDYEPARWKLTLLAITRKLPDWAVKRPTKWLLASPGFAPDQAAMSFSALGPAAAPAITELEIRAQSNSHVIRWRALAALSNIGPIADPATARALSKILTEPESITDAWVGHSLVIIGPAARPLIPLLVQYLDHTNATIAIASAKTLGNLRSEPDLAIPALMGKLGDTRVAVSNQVVLALADFGPPALNQLKKGLSDPDPLVRQNATNAIARIKAPRSYPGGSSPFQ